LPTIFEILASYDRGLTELARGYRFVWQCGEPLEYAIDRYNYLNAYFFPTRITGSVVRNSAAYPPKIDALAKLLHASEYQMENAPLEPSSLNNDLAQLRSVGLLLSPGAYDNTFYTLPYPVFPANLPEVPEPVGRWSNPGQSALRRHLGARYRRAIEVAGRCAGRQSQLAQQRLLQLFHSRHPRAEPPG
jgi:hypothetical protein